VSLFLSSAPLWLSAFLLVLVPTALAASGLVLVRRRVGLARLVANNEVAGFKFAVVGVIYAVLLAFAVIVVWERYTEAEVAVVHEAGAAATVFRLAAGPEPEATAVRNGLIRYLHVVIDRDWPRMAEEHESREATIALNELYTRVLLLESTLSRPPAVLIAMLNQLDAMTEARRTRLHLGVGIMPSVMWLALTVGGILTVGFTFFFGARNLTAQIMMTCILAVIVFMGLFVIVAIDHPFTGPVHVDPMPLEKVLADFNLP
jgi:Protein of unknown function (DUF4239)